MARLEAAGGAMLQLVHRPWLVAHYAWAVTNPAVIDALVNLSPIFELGAGFGYWAHRIQEAGGQVRAADTLEFLTEAQQLELTIPPMWFPVEVCPATGVTANPDDRWTA